MLTAGTICVDVFAPIEAAPSGTILTLRDMSYIPPHMPIARIAWYIVSILFDVALTKVLYAAYHDHEEKSASQMSGFVSAFVRTIVSMILYGFAMVLLAGIILLFVLIPVAVLVLVAVISAFIAGTTIHALTDLQPVAAGLILFLALTFAILGGQYIAVAAAVSSRNILSVVGEGIRAVLAPKRIVRILTIGAIYFLAIIAMLTISQLISKQIALLFSSADPVIIVNCIDNLVINPLMFSFGVVFYADTMKRMALESETKMQQASTELS